MKVINTCLTGVILVILVFFGFEAFERLGKDPAWVSIAVFLGLACSFVLGLRALTRIRQQGSTQTSSKLSRIAMTLVSALILALLVAWWIMRPIPPMGEGPAGPPLNKQAFQKTWRDGPVQFISIGDSISTGFGAPIGEGFPLLMIRNQDSVFPKTKGLDLTSVLPELRYSLLAKNSTNSFDHHQVIKDLPQYPTDHFGIVTMTTGGIDLLHKYGKFAPVEGALYGATLEQAQPWISNLKKRLLAMVDLLQQKFPGGLKIYLATIYDPTDNVGDVENAGPKFWLPAWEDGLMILTKFNDVIKHVASERQFVYVADVHKTMLGHGIHCTDPSHPNYNRDDPGYWYFRNLEDPNVRGHDAIRRTFLNAIAGSMTDSH